MGFRLKSQTPRRIGTLISALVVAVHLVNALVAAWMGSVARFMGLSSAGEKPLCNGYPTLDNTSYFAVFPFGYPLLLALVSPGLDLAQRAVMAKLANASLWISAYFVLKRLRISPVVAAALVTTPFSLWIAAMTWSENLMLLALILTLAGIDRLQEEERSYSQATSIIFLLGALLLGVASRYVFGFVILGFAAAYLVSFRKMLRPTPYSPSLCRKRSSCSISCKFAPNRILNWNKSKRDMGKHQLSGIHIPAS